MSFLNFVYHEIGKIKRIHDFKMKWVNWYSFKGGLKRKCNNSYRLTTWNIQCIGKNCKEQNKYFSFCLLWLFAMATHRSSFPRHICDVIMFIQKWICISKVIYIYIEREDDQKSWNIRLYLNTDRFLDIQTWFNINKILFYLGTIRIPINIC